jgi:hypothetical protein
MASIRLSNRSMPGWATHRMRRLTDAPQLTDDVLQLYTSGTTGLPKGVVLTNSNYRTFLEAATEVDGFAYGEDETVMIVMPLFHVAGTNVSFSGLAQGGRLVLVKDFTARRRDPHDARRECGARLSGARDDPDDAASACRGGGRHIPTSSRSPMVRRRSPRMCCAARARPSAAISCNFTA